MLPRQLGCKCVVFVCVAVETAMPPPCSQSAHVDACTAAALHVLLHVVTTTHLKLLHRPAIGPLDVQPHMACNTSHQHTPPALVQGLFWPQLTQPFHHSQPSDVAAGMRVTNPL